MLNTSHSILELADGAKIAYEILGKQHLGSRQPLVLVGGMSSRRIDWERLANSLSTVRPILLYDHRGMGDSELSPGMDEKITVESLARDLLSLLTHLQWKDLSLCGFSMGGVISQQLLFLQYHPTRPANLPFRVTHVLLAGTLCSALKDPRYGLRINRNVPDRSLTPDEKREIARGTLESTFDPVWLANPTNSERFRWWLDRMIIGGRPTSVIGMNSSSNGTLATMTYDSDVCLVKQGRAMNALNFEGYHDKLSKDTQFLVIHGELDKVVPFYCDQEILHRIPWARLVEVGNRPGQVANYAFGHHWFEYFDIEVWHDVVETFLAKQRTDTARL